MNLLGKIKKNSLLRKLIAFLAHLFYGFPGRNLIFIGVTGTTGKTTTCFMIKSILENNNIKTGLISSAGFYVGSEIIYPKAHTPATTPDPFMLCSLLRKMKKNNIKVVIIEVTSFGLMYERVFGLNFSAAVLTNISDNHHLALHGGMDQYTKAKLKLFKHLNNKAIAVLPKDSEYFDLFSKKTQAKVISFGSQETNDLWFKTQEISKDSNKAIIFCGHQSFDLNLPLLGFFNIYNSLAAIGAVQIFTLGLEQIKKGLEDLHQIPGRLENIKTKQPFSIIVDKANNPAAYYGVIDFIKVLNPKRKIVIYGNFGESPKRERKQLAEIATNFFDLTIITEDDPQELSALPGINDFLDFVKEKNIDSKKYLAINNRKEAIRKAIQIAKKGDLIAILGRGNEQFMDYGIKTTLFDDRKVTREVLKEEGY